MARFGVRVLLTGLAIVCFTGIWLSIGRRADLKQADTAALPPVGATLAVTDVAGTIDGNADPGDTLEYTLTITNGGTDATGVNMTSTLSSLTTLDNTFGSSGVTVTPIVTDDAYSVAGNVRIQPAAGSGLLSNDINPFTGNSTGLTFTATSIKSAQCVTAGCTNNNVAINVDGSFSYDPPPGYTGTDTFTYTVTNAGGGSSTATVTLTITGMIWFINNNAAACTTLAAGCGRLTTPFSTLAAFQALNNGTGNNPAANDNIFVYESATAYTGGVTLLSGQKLIGQDAAATLATITGVTVPSFSDALPTMNTGGIASTIQNAGGNGVTLNSGNTLRGFTGGNSSGSSISGTGFGTLTVADMIVNSTGQALALANGTIAGTGFSSITSTGGTNNISFITLGGTLIIAGGALSGSTGANFFNSQGNAAVSYAGTINRTNAGRMIEIASTTGGSYTFTGTLTSGAAGGTQESILLSSNAATFTFSGGLSITSTSTGTAFSATGGGTVNICSVNPCGGGTPVTNTISATSGTALNIVNTTIGASGITFRSINKNGGTNNGINLNNTGTGALTVSGTGTAGSGGTIENISNADAVRLNNTSGLVTLQHMIIEDITASTDATDANNTHSGIDGIHGTLVNAGLTLNSVTIQRISDNAINGTVDGVPVTNNPTSTVWNGLTVTNSSIQNTSRFNVANRGDSSNESAIIIWGIKGTVSVTGTTFQNDSSGIDFITDSSGTLDMTVQGSAFNTLYKEIGTSSIGRFGISVVQEGTLTSTVRIGDWQNESNAALGNTFTNGGNVVAIRVISNTTAFGNLKALISKNTFTVTDHSSPGQPPLNTFYNIPQSGVLLRHVGSPSFLGGGNFESIVAANTFNECMHADGGLGNLSVIMEKGNAETIVRNNIFNKPWDLPMELRSDGQSTTQASNRILVTGNTHIDGIVGDGTTDLGGQSPYGSTYVQVRNNGRMDLTMRDEATPLGLTDPSSATGTVSLFTQATTAGDILNVFLSNIQGPRGYRLSQAPGSTYNLFRNGSVSGTAQGVLQDNIVRGGGGVDTTNPPTVTATGTITLSNSAPILPNITVPFAPLVEEGENVDLSLINTSYQTPSDMLEILEPFLESSETNSIGSSSVRSVFVAKASDKSSLIIGLLAQTTKFIGDALGKLGEAISPTVTAQEAKDVPIGLSGETITVNGSGSGFLIPAGRSITIKYRATVNNGPYASGANTIDNSATVSGTNFPSVPSNIASLNLDAAPNLSVVNSDGATETQPGVVVVYNLSYANATGNNLQNTSQTRLSVQVPLNTSFNAASSGTGWSCADGATNPTTCTNDIGALTAGANGTKAIAFNIPGNLPATALSIAPTATIAENPANQNGTDLDPANNTSTDTNPVRGVWVGGTSALWTLNTNWSNSLLPIAAQNISVPSGGGANSPGISGSSQTVNNIVFSGKDLTIGAAVNLTVNGSIALGANSVNGPSGLLVLGNSASITRTTGQVNTSMTKNFNTLGAFTFPVGVAGGGYSPVNVNITAGTGSLSTKANTGTAPVAPVPLTAAKTLQRYWTLTGSGVTSDITFNYLQTDVPVTAVESAFRIVRVVDGTSAVSYIPNGTNRLLDTTNNTFTMIGLSAYSDWTLAEPIAPVASNVELSGRVLDRNGRGVAGVPVVMTDQNNVVRYSMTNSFGYYRFAGITAGQTVVVAAGGKRFVYEPRTVLVSDSISTLDFVPNE